VTHSAEDFIKHCARVAEAVGWQAGVGASETAGHIVSVLAAHPEHLERFMTEGSELFIDGTMRPENGSLNYLARNGEITSPRVLREALGIEQ
jgi:hypothetical protein